MYHVSCSSNLSLNLPNPILTHRIRRHRVPVPHLLRHLHPQHRHAVLNRPARPRDAAIGEGVGVRKVLRQQAQLPQHGALVPADVLVVEPVAADVDDACEGYLDFFVGWGDTGDAVFGSETASFERDVEGEGGRGAYSQSSGLSWVNLKMNSSITRSMPIVRLTISRAVSSELLKMKLSR
jgi:hypothetical protein